MTHSRQSSPEKAETLLRETEAFDSQIRERIAGGHYPDLRCEKPCDWFYNNTWRHPALVDLDFGEIFRRLHTALSENLPQGRNKILEIGCGPGHISLELSRNGYDVTGVDLSPACIEIAQKVAKEDKWKSERGGLRYLAGDIFELGPQLETPFDAVIFVGALHHFPDQQAILALVGNLLAPDGLVLAHEPVRDKVTKGNAALLTLLRMVFSQSGTWYRDLELPKDESALSEEIERGMNELCCLDEHGDKAQSDNDNEAGFEEMHTALKEAFDILTVEPRHAIFHELAGGIRFDDAKNADMATLLFHMDHILIKEGVLSPSEFFFIARNKEKSITGRQPKEAKG